MKITDQLPIRNIPQQQYFAERGNALSVDALVEGDDYFVRLIVNPDDSNRYAADFWVEIDKVKVPKWNVVLPPFMTKYARVTMLPIDQDAYVITDKPDQRKALYDGTIVVPFWSDWPNLRYEDGYFAHAIDERDFALSSLLNTVPSGSPSPAGS